LIQNVYRRFGVIGLVVCLMFIPCQH
jgi:hypothetical protein